MWDVPPVDDFWGKGQAPALPAPPGVDLSDNKLSIHDEESCALEEEEEALLSLGTVSANDIWVFYVHEFEESANTIGYAITGNTCVGIIDPAYRNNVIISGKASVENGILRVLAHEI